MFKSPVNVDVVTNERRNIYGLNKTSAVSDFASLIRETLSKLSQEVEYL